jgi:SNF2 family DNA or RNA helicase
LSQHINNYGSILADEMGLGKTISTIALMTTLYTTKWEKLAASRDISQEKGPYLIVCPATVISQWVQEIKVWTSTLQEPLKILTFAGVENIIQKSRIIKEAFSSDGVVITSYEFLRNESKLFTNKKWFYVILDEA